MKLQDLREDIEDLDLANSDGSSGEWLISYSDLVTVLLCFFIMFFTMKSQQQEKAFLKQSRKAFKTEVILSDVTKKINASKLASKSEVQKFERHIALFVANQVFEDSGIELNLDGKYFFSELAGVIYQFQPSIQIQLSLGRNIEESDESAMAKVSLVRKFLTELGLNQEAISIGTHDRAPASITEDSKDEIKVFISNNNQTANNEN